MLNHPGLQGPYLLPTVMVIVAGFILVGGTVAFLYFINSGQWQRLPKAVLVMVFGAFLMFVGMAIRSSI